MYLFKLLPHPKSLDLWFSECQQKWNIGIGHYEKIKKWPLLGHRHATISFICMSTHKATAARCLSYHQATYGQPAIQALATAPLRRLALSVHFTIMTNSYKTTCTVSKRTFSKRQHANARHGVDSPLFMHYDMVAAQT